ncbi:MAG: chromosomal replication initiator protein DnaA [bacterium]
MIDNYVKLWNSVLSAAEQEYDEQTFNEIFSCCEYKKFEQGYLYVVTPTQYIQNKLNRFHINKINEIISKLTEENVKFKFLLQSELEELENAKVPVQDIKNLYRNNIRTSFSFDNFVVGQSNMFAFRMAMKIADQPGIVANPLYIFGSVGLGKTHLMQAVGNYILDSDINKQILYVKADQFIEDYTKFAKGIMPDFEDKYNNLDVLLIDDIQLLEIGQKSQVQFFKVFDLLANQNKQIIITSDRPSHELNIMDRLTSRFSAGLTVDVATPNLDHRVNILKRKVLESTELEVDEDVLEFIASIFTNNIRELEGAFTRVLYFCSTLNIKMNLENAKEALASLINNKRISNSHNETNFTKVQDVVAAFYNITINELTGSKRTAKFVLARHLAMYILKSNYGLSYKKIGSLFEGRDHSTVMSGCERIENELKTSEDLKMAFDTIVKKID